MGESAESILLRMGFDSTAVTVGTEKMLAIQKKAALDYTSFWETALAKQDAAEMIAVDKSIARARAAAAAKVRIQAEAMAALAAQNAANTEIAAGSGAFGSIEAAAAGAAGGGIVSATRGAAREAHGFAGIMRETMVLFREGLRGNWTRMVGSLTLLISYTGAMAAAVAIPLALIVGPSGYSYYKARKQEQQSEEDLKGATSSASEIVRQRVEDLHRAGIITDRQAENYSRQLKSGDVNGVLLATNPLLANGTASEQLKRAETAKEVARINAQTAKESLAAHREEVPLLARMQSLEIERHNIQERMTGMKKDSVEYAQAEHDIAALTLDINKDQNALAKEKAELQKQHSAEVKKAQDIYGDALKVDVEAPTIAELAGRSLTTRLNKLYGKGGRYDLESGDGPFGNAARNAEVFQKQEMWDIIHGNATFNDKGELTGGQAFVDRQNRMAAENLLAGAGVDTPAMKFTKMNEQLADINKTMTDLLKRASTDGIVLTDKPA